MKASPHTISIAAVVLALASAAVLLPFVARPEPDAHGLERLPLPTQTHRVPAVTQTVERQGWTQFDDYRTIRLGEVERTAQIIDSRTRVVRRLRVPSEGARYEVHLGGIDRAVDVRIQLADLPPTSTVVEKNIWTPITVPLDPRHGRFQTLTLVLDGEPDALAAWGQEIVTPVARNRSRPDVYIISLDTVRRDQLTPYNPSLATTPALAEFARESIRFDEAISTSSWTVAAHATLFTGEFPADSLGYGSRVEPEELTLAERFAAAGYRTFGLSGGPYTDPRWGLHQGFDEYVVSGMYVVSGERENARRATNFARAWLSQSGTAPVFMFLNYFNAHEPLELSPDVQQSTGVTEGVSGSEWHDLDSRRAPITDAVRARLLRAYRAELTEIDSQLGVFFDTLKRLGRWDNSVVLVWADHGQLLGERGLVGHAFTLDEELIRVPLVIKAPRDAMLEPGVYPWLFQNDDLFLLCQTLAGFKAERDLVPDVKAGRPVRPLAFAKIHHEPLAELVAATRWRSATLWAVRDRASKVVRDLEGGTYAYDVRVPEGERLVPVAVESPLLNALDHFTSWSQRRDSKKTVGPLSPGELQRLRTLGYIR